jgi:hypothetical protein
MMCVLTASTKSQSQLTDIQKESCLINGIHPELHLCLPISESYPRHPSWFKVRALIEHLRNHEFVCWMDADAMMVKEIDWKFYTGGDSTCYITRDRNGLNCGVMIWRNCPKAFEALWEIYDSYEKFSQHPWYEQGALHTMAERIDIGPLPKTIFNSYPSDRSTDSCILHWPATKHDERLEAMKTELNKLRNR